MKRLIIPIISTLVIALGFIGGLFTQTTALILPAFCLWTPSIFWLGYSFAKAGKISIQFMPSEVTAPEYRKMQKSGAAFK